MAQYLPYDNYGPPDPLEADPYAQCLTQDFFYSGNALGPFSRACKLYMSERCSKNWDNACEVYSQNEIPDYPSELTTSFEDMYTRLPEGQKFIRNTADAKFCTFTGPECYATFSDFNPMAPNTPTLTQYGGICYKVCDKFDETSANSPVIQKCLQSPGLCGDTLKGMCYEAGKRTGSGKSSLPAGSALAGYCSGDGAAAYTQGTAAATAAAAVEEGYSDDNGLGEKYGLEKMGKYGNLTEGPGAAGFAMPPSSRRRSLIAALVAIVLLLCVIIRYRGQ